jgi:hypothetical protein
MKINKQSLKIKLFGIFFLTLIITLLFQELNKSFNYPVIFSIELKTDQNEDCQLFYTTGKDEFDETQTMINTHKADSDFEELFFHLPPTKIYSIRLDPGTQSFTYYIKNISIQVGDQKTTYSAEMILDHFTLINLKRSEIRDSEILVLITEENPDAQLILKGSLSERFKLENTLAIRIMLWILSIFYLASILAIVLIGNKIYTGLEKSRLHPLGFITPCLSYKYLFDYFKTNRWLIIFSLLIAVLSFGYELFNFSLSIDEEIDSFRNANNSYVFISVGRWGLYLINLFFQPVSVVPYYPTLIALLCLSATSIIFVTNSSGSMTSKMVFTILFITSPIHSYYLAFNTSGMYYAMGMVLTAIAFQLYRTICNKTKFEFKHYFFVVMLMAFSISLYQSNLVFFIVFVVYYLLMELLTREKYRWNDLLYAIGVLLGIVITSYIVYKIGDYSAREILQALNEKNNTEYIDNFSKWGVLKTDHILSLIYNETIEYLTGTGLSGSPLGLSLKSLLIILIIIIIQIMISEKRKLQKTLSMIALTFLVISPFVILYLYGTKLPIRAMIPVTLMIALLWFISYQQAGSLVRKILFLAAFVILINNTFINTRLFYATNIAWQADRDIANRIIERIYQLNPPIEKGKINVVFSGNYTHSENPLFYKSEIHGASFFEWSPGKTYRMKAFLKTIGINEINDLPVSKLEHRKSEIKAMPSWPNYGSVVLIDDIVVVKLSD